MRASPTGAWSWRSLDKVITDLGTADIDGRLEELMIDGILYAFQEQVSLSTRTPEDLHVQHRQG